MLKRIPIVLVVGVLLTALHVSTAIPRLQLGSQFINQLDLAAYDWMIKNNASSQRSDAVAIVDIDEESLGKLGQWPWPRYQVAQMTHNLLEAGAAVVGFDVVFPEPDRTSPVVLEQKFSSAFGGDVQVKGIPDELLFQYDRRGPIRL